jgi:hypothetical protein
MFSEWAGHNVVSIMTGYVLYKIPFHAVVTTAISANILTQLTAQEDVIEFIYLWQLQIYYPLLLPVHNIQFYFVNSCCLCVVQYFDYIELLAVLWQVFEKPLLECQVLSPQDVQKIFVNWREIINCNNMFLRLVERVYMILRLSQWRMLRLLSSGMSLSRKVSTHVTTHKHIPGIWA